jgi:hypothetical protein
MLSGVQRWFRRQKTVTKVVTIIFVIITIVTLSLIPLTGLAIFLFLISMTSPASSSPNNIKYLTEYSKTSYYKYLSPDKKKEIKCVVDGKCKKTKDITNFVKRYNKCFELYDLGHINFKVLNEGIIGQKKFERYDRKYEKIRDRFSDAVDMDDLGELCKDTRALNDVVS